MGHRTASFVSDGWAGLGSSVIGFPVAMFSCCISVIVNLFDLQYYIHVFQRLADDSTQHAESPWFF